MCMIGIKGKCLPQILPHFEKFVVGPWVLDSVISLQVLGSRYPDSKRVSYSPIHKPGGFDGPGWNQENLPVDFSKRFQDLEGLSKSRMTSRWLVLIGKPVIPFPLGMPDEPLCAADACLPWNRKRRSVLLVPNVMLFDSKVIRVSLELELKMLMTSDSSVSRSCSTYLQLQQHQSCARACFVRGAGKRGWEEEGRK